MGVQNILVYTHDSLALGEDGPTHQPVEQLATLRMTPGLENWRPADQVETAFAWRAALARTNAPTSLILSRQGLPCAERTDAQLEAIDKGGYVLADAEDAQAVLVATGSEVTLALEAAEALAADGTPVRVVSMPCLERFAEQDPSYWTAVLPAGLPRLVIEAAHPAPWWRIAGGDGDVLGVDRFGMSAPGGTAMAEVGFTVENVVARVRALLD
jgi:transketolase